MSTFSTTSTSDKENDSILLHQSRTSKSAGKEKRKYDHESQSSDDDGGNELDLNQSQDGGNESSFSSDSESDLMVPVPVRKKLRRDPSDSNNGDSDYSRDTLPVSPAPSNESHDDDTSSNQSRDGSESSETPKGEWEIEEILDFVRDDFGEYYLVKWKDWETIYNTWEPISNLLHCEEELFRFYTKRKQQVRDGVEICVEDGLGNITKRKKVREVPPDPRPFDARVQNFLDLTGAVSDEEIANVFYQFRGKTINSKARWPLTKVDKYLQDGIDGLLSVGDIKALKDELILIEVENRKKSLATQIQTWENRINAITEGRPKITIENDVDIHGPPIGFEFVNDYVAGEFGYTFAYTKYRKVNLLQGSPIYECNSKCGCGPECPNRVVQDGKSDHKLSIFRTSDGRGWGVKTLKSIKKGSFVTLYVGEVIKSEEAERRGRIYDEAGITYLFDLDFNDPDSYPYSVDASKFGNVAHFINHSCNPNLGVYAVWVDCLDPNLPKLAMFALRDIPRNEELTFDYDYSVHGPKKKPEEQQEEDPEKPLSKKTRCLCGAPKCRKFVFTL